MHLLFSRGIPHPTPLRLALHHLTSSRLSKPCSGRQPELTPLQGKPCHDRTHQTAHHHAAPFLTRACLDWAKNVSWPLKASPTEPCTAPHRRPSPGHTSIGPTTEVAGPLRQAAPGRARPHRSQPCNTAQSHALPNPA